MPPIRDQMPPLETKCPPLETKCPPLETKYPTLETLITGAPTKDRRDLIGTEVVERQVEECAQLIGDEADKCLMVGHPHKAVTEDTETLVHPEPGHG